MGQLFNVRQLNHEDLSLHGEFLKEAGASIHADGFVVGCWTGEALVGVASFRRDVQGDGHIYGLFVAESLRGRRIATILVAEILETVQYFEGLEFIRAAVQSGGKGSALLRAAGFEAEGSVLVLSLSRLRGEK